MKGECRFSYQVKKQEQQARLSNPGTDPRSAAVESVDLKSKFEARPCFRMLKFLAREGDVFFLN